METEGSVPDVINDQHQLNPDIRLVRIYMDERESSGESQECEVYVGNTCM
jgi:hypothetical protein